MHTYHFVKVTAHLRETKRVWITQKVEDAILQLSREPLYDVDRRRSSSMWNH